MFTTFGPGRPPLIAAVGSGDLADIDRLLADGNIDKESLNDALCTHVAIKTRNSCSVSSRLGPMSIKSTRERSLELV